MKKFNVITVDFNSQKISYYDVLPYFCRTTTYMDGRVVGLKNIKTKKDLYKFVEQTSQHEFWARCQYEHLVAPWPYDEKRDSLVKIDVHEQVMMNIDIIVDVLAEEYKIK